MTAAGPQIPEHSEIGVSMGTVVCNRIADLLPALQAHLMAGGSPRGMNVRISFRAGHANEAPVVGEMEFSPLSGDSQQWLIAPSASTGQFAMMSFANPEGANGSAQMQPPPPLPPPPGRQPLPRPQIDGLQPPPEFAPLTAPIESLMLPDAPPPPPSTPDQAALLEKLMQTLTPEQQAAFAVTQNPPMAPAPAPKRLTRPPMAGDEGMR